MPDRRRPLSQITPDYEDAGLFKNKLGKIDVELVPQMSRNARQDLVVRGFMNGHIRIDVLFAGRRGKETAALEARLRALRARAGHATHAGGVPFPDIDRLRCPVSIEGSWRPKFFRDDSGWETRTYQLIAARWSLMDQNRNMVFFGSRPVPRVKEPSNTHYRRHSVYM